MEKGRATLTGTADTWLVRQQAATVAYELGAWDVNNHVRTIAGFYSGGRASASKYQPLTLAFGSPFFTAAASAAVIRKAA